MDFPILDDYRNGKPLVDDHVCLVHGNVNDLFFNPETFAQESLMDRLIRMASPCFNEIQVTDLVTPLTKVFSNPDTHAIGSDKDQGDENGRFDGMAKRVNQRIGVNASDHHFLQTMGQVGNLLRDRSQKRCIVIDYIERVFSAQAFSQEMPQYFTHLFKWMQDPNIRKSKNLALLICRNWEELCGELKKTHIPRLEIPLPDRSSQEEYLRFLAHYLPDILKKEVRFSGKGELLAACQELKLTLQEVRKLAIEAGEKGERFSSGWIHRCMNSGKAGMWDFYSIPGEKILKLSEMLGQEIIGQPEAIDAIKQVLLIAHSGLSEKNKPIALLLFVGPTGTGKSYIAKVIARLLFGSENALIYKDLSESKNRGDISQITGASPGYIGYDAEGGSFIREIKQKKSGVILIDEIEKADPEVLDILLSIGGEGQISSASTGEKVDLSRFIIILTSNLGTTASMAQQDQVGKKEVILQAVKAGLSPELYNRFDDVIVFQNLTPVDCCRIVDIELKKRLNNILENKNIEITYSDRVIEEVVARGYSTDYNARALKRVMDKIILNPISQKITSGAIKERDRININWADGRLSGKYVK